MGFCLPDSHGHSYAHKRVPSRTMTVRTPKDLPWKILGTLAKGLSPWLSKSELELVGDCVRTRSLELLSDLEGQWRPQGFAPSMLHDECFTQNFFAKYQLASVLKKYPFPGDTSLRSEKALEKFLAAEATCGRYNRQRKGTLDRISDQHPDLLGAVDHMRSFIQSVLPDYDPVMLEDELSRNGRHGPGSTVCTTKGEVTPFFKWSTLPYSVTTQCRALAIQAIDSDPRWVGALQDWYRNKNGIPFESGINLDDFWSQVLEVVPGNVITWVPKDRKIDRSIAIEPRMNLFLQLGMDQIIRTRLKRFGCDLDDQRKNQELARLGSLTGKYATLDLSAASDTISLTVVEELFPPVWVDAMMNLRSPTGRIRSTDQTLVYEKLSSMGNGYTFAIESLIFLSACYAALKCYELLEWKRGDFSLHDDIAVYGDDLVVPVAFVDRLISLLHYCGFSVNVEKSFASGPFRESCGSDYLLGIPVRPLFLREEVGDVLQVFSIINRCQPSHTRLPLWDGCYGSSSPPLSVVPSVLMDSWSDPYQGVRELLFQYLPSWARRIVGPASDEEVDTYLHVPRSEAPMTWKNGLYSFFRVVKVSLPSKKGSSHLDFLFRKLMCLNRQCDNRFSRLPPPAEFPGSRGMSAGSVFTVTERGFVGYMLTEARTSFWF